MRKTRQKVFFCVIAVCFLLLSGCVAVVDRTGQKQEVSLYYYITGKIKESNQLRGLDRDTLITYRFLTVGVLSDGTKDYRQLTTEEDILWSKAVSDQIMVGPIGILDSGGLITTYSCDGKIELLMPQDYVVSTSTIRPPLYYLSADIYLPNPIKEIPARIVPTNGKLLSNEYTLTDELIMEKLIVLASTEAQELDLASFPYRSMYLHCFYPVTEALSYGIEVIMDTDTGSMYAHFPQIKYREAVPITDDALLTTLFNLFLQIEE